MVFGGSTTLQRRNEQLYDKIVAKPKVKFSENKINLQNVTTDLPLSTFLCRLQRLFLKRSPVSTEFLQVLQSAKLSEGLVANKTTLAKKQQPSSHRVPSRLLKQQQQQQLPSHDTYESATEGK